MTKLLICRKYTGHIMTILITSKEAANKKCPSVQGKGPGRGTETSQNIEFKRTTMYISYDMQSTGAWWLHLNEKA